MSNSTTAQERNLAEGGDGCCHKTRLKDAPCPVGWKCPYIKETPVSNTTTPRCGDHVLHRPSGETWVVAWCEGNDLAWSGWPNGMARTSDCEIVKSATDKEFADHLVDVLLCSDSRAARAKRLYVKEHTS